jgi:hypothetical protein
MKKLMITVESDINVLEAHRDALLKQRADLNDQFRAIDSALNLFNEIINARKQQLNIHEAR